MAFRHTPYHMLIEALGQDGCPICTLVHEEVLHYLHMLLHEHVNDLDVRAELRQVGGFCNTHGWWLHTRVQGGALGATIMYRDVLNSARTRIEQIATSGGTVLNTPRRRRGLGPFAAGPLAQVDPHTGCPACQVRARGEETFVGTLIANATDERFLDRYERSAGVCLIHLDQVLVTVRDVASVRRLLQKQAGIMQRLIGELDEFQRKSDYRFHGEPIDAEADAWLRAIELIDGKEGAR
ncbi:MAG TPA: DUF6062 family protein [Chloroflexota bacterium]|nr:DUF6062 family protein [Chloroflexota bacterium]